MPDAEVIPLRLSRPAAEALIHRLAAEGQFVIEPVCKKKMAERDYSMRQVLVALKEGHVNQGPERADCGDWKCRIKKRAAGRLVRVIVAIHATNFLYVISVH